MRSSRRFASSCSGVDRRGRGIRRRFLGCLGAHRRRRTRLARAGPHRIASTARITVMVPGIPPWFAIGMAFAVVSAEQPDTTEELDGPAG